MAETAKVTVKDFDGNAVPYEGVKKVKLNTADGETQIFSKGTAVENVPITLDFSSGDMSVTAEDDTLMKSVVIAKPENLVSENIKKDEVVAGILGTHEGGGGTTSSFLSEEPWLDDVCFWDLEGNLIRNIPMNQIKNLTELPTAPAYDNLIFECWNHTLEEITSTECPLDIAPIYSTADGKTHVKISPYSTSTLAYKFNFTQTVENGVTFDFGDGSDPQTVAGTGAVYITHTFPSAGEYEIVISVEDGCVLGLSGGTSSAAFVMGATSTQASSTAYAGRVTDLMVADGVEINSCCIYYFYGLKFLSLPKTLKSIADYNFQSTAKLNCIAIPNGVTNVGKYVFRSLSDYSYGLCRKVISLPQSVQTFGDECFSYSHKVERLVIPKNVTNFPYYGMYDGGKDLKRLFFKGDIKTAGAYSLQSLISLNEFDFSKISTTPSNFIKRIGVESLMISSAVITIGNYFAEEAATKEVYIPSSVTTMGTYFMQNCYALKRVIFEDASTLTSIGSSFLYNSYNFVREIIFLSENLPTESIFKKIVEYSRRYAVYVPDGTVEAYKALPNNSYYYDIRPLSEYHGTIPGYND